MNLFYLPHEGDVIITSSSSSSQSSQNTGNGGGGGTNDQSHFGLRKVIPNSPKRNQTSEIYPDLQ
jgi:hypothetical protein